MTKLQGEISPAFAALREAARLYQAVMSQTLIAWPLICAKGILLSSGLEAPLRKQKFSDLFEECLADLEAEVGPLYSIVFSRVHGSNPLRFDSTRASSTAAVRKILDAADTRWEQTFTLDPAPLYVTPLFQIHRLKDVDGKFWQLKVIKPSAREKLNSTLNALRDIESVLRPFKNLPKVSELWNKVETLRLKAQREADLRVERRTLQRATRHGHRIEIHPKFDHVDLLVTADPNRMNVDDVKKSVAKVWPIVWKSAKSSGVTKESKRRVSVATSFEGFPVKSTLISGFSVNTKIPRSQRRH
ncbi:MAG: hypothetical protein EOP10_14865 [Proteobacteria bacterium]|nr:MAG: hypothetical protein EOP10_14865 [Pseudomonadota bacterium]